MIHEKGPDQKTASAYLEAIDLMRCFFALLVMFYHCSYWLPLPLPGFMMSALRVWGIYGVEGFFVISGIALSVATPSGQFGSMAGIGAFYLRRYARIVPLYALLLLYKTGGSVWHPERALELSMFFGFVDPTMATLTGGWSLGVEFVFYFLFPFLALVCGRNLWRSAAAGIASAILMMWFSSTLEPAMDLGAQWVWFTHPLNHLFFFAIGYLCGVFYLQMRDHNCRWLGNRGVIGVASIAIFSLVCLLGVGGAQIQIVTGYRRTLISVLVVMLVGLQIFWNLGGRAPRILGNASYALYLIHPMIVLHLLPHIGLENVWWQFVVVVVSSGMLAALSFTAFEKPIQRTLRKVILNR